MKVLTFKFIGVNKFLFDYKKSVIVSIDSGLINVFIIINMMANIQDETLDT